MKKLIVGLTLLASMTAQASQQNETEYVIPGENFELDCQAYNCFGMPSLEELKAEVANFSSVRAKQEALILAKIEQLAEYADRVKAEATKHNKNTSYSEAYYQAANNILEKLQHKEKHYENVLLHVSSNSPFIEISNRIIERYETNDLAASEVSDGSMKAELLKEAYWDTKRANDDKKLFKAIEMHKIIKQDFVATNDYIDIDYINSYHARTSSYALNLIPYVDVANSCEKSDLINVLETIQITGGKYSLGLLDNKDILKGILSSGKRSETPMTLKCSRNYSKRVQLNSKKNLLKLKIYTEKRATGEMKYGWFSDSPKVVKRTFTEIGFSGVLEALHGIKNLYLKH